MLFDGVRFKLFFKEHKQFSFRIQIYFEATTHLSISLEFNIFFCLGKHSRFRQSCVSRNLNLGSFLSQTLATREAFRLKVISTILETTGPNYDVRTVMLKTEQET